jgi:hypothetical protein
MHSFDDELALALDDELSDGLLPDWISEADARAAALKLIEQTEGVDAAVQHAVRDGKIDEAEYDQWATLRDEVFAWTDKSTSSFTDWRLWLTSVQTLNHAERLQAKVAAYSKRLELMTGEATPVDFDPLADKPPAGPDLTTALTLTLIGVSALLLYKVFK